MTKLEKGRAEVSYWLAELGLSQYAQAFLDNHVDWDLLPQISDSDLERLGVGSLGHRKRILTAIQSITEDAPARAQADLDAPKSQSPTAGPEAERRHLTVMFCDLVGSTTLAEQLDPEDLREVLRSYQDTCAGVVSRFEGYVAKYIGDGLLIYFGFPRAHEDDAERAVRSALGILSSVGALRTKAGQALSVRIGIATGMVVVGDIIGEASSQEHVVIGETPNLAARLQALATPNSVVISDETHDLLGRQFEYRNLGRQKLKGISRPIEIWQVTGERPIETRFRATHSGRLTSLVGRDQEIELLIERWRRALTGEGQLVMLSGEAGIGKSRIAEALRQAIENEEQWHVHYQCSPHHVNSPMYPAIQQLQFAAGITREDEDVVKLKKLEELLQQTGAIDCTPLLAALLAIPITGRYEPLALDPLEQKQKTLRALSALFEGLAERRPVLFVLEDAHWIDPTTQELIDLLADRLISLRALMLITYRPGFLAPWASHAHCTTLTLNRLGRTASAALISDLTSARKVPEEVLEQIISRTDGVPLFVEEMTKTVIESGLLTEKDGSYVLTGPALPLAIPFTLQDSLMARLDRLNGAKEIAQIGAAIGREFSHALIEAVSPIKGYALDTGLQVLRDSQIIFRRGDSKGATYIFKHALIQDAAYDSLLRSRRQQIHARVAEALRALSVETEPEIIAHHLTQAGQGREAAPEWLRAGQRAIARSANAEAIAHLRHGLEALRGVADCEDKRSLELDMQISLGSATIAVRGYSATETEAAYSRARQLLAQTEHDDRQFAVLHGLAMVYWNRAQFKSMHQVAEDMLARAERHGDSLPRLVAHRVMGVLLNTTGKFAEASLHADRAVNLYVPDQHGHTAHIFGHDMGVGALWHAAIARLFMGDLQSSAIFARKAADLTRQLQNANTTSYSGLWTAFTSLLRRDWLQARETSNEMMADAGKRSMALWVVFAQHLLGCALSALGEPKAALAEIHRGRRAAEALENTVFKPMTLCFEAQALAALGRFDEAFACLTEALTLVEETGERWWEAEIHRVMGETLIAFGDATKSAEASFRKAIEIATQQEARLLKLRSAMSLGRLLSRETTRRDEARSVVSAVCGEITEHANPEFVEAKTFLANGRASET